MRRDFTTYADVCFREFGDKVSHWTTINEANTLPLGSYNMEFVHPKNCSAPFGMPSNCTTRNSVLDAYIVAHNSLLAHASAARLYKRKYQAKQQGFVGLNTFVYWFIPLTNTTEDVMAAQRIKAFFTDWFIYPLVFGYYPDIVKKNAGSKLPSFTQHESCQVKGSYDFIGLNHYSTLYVKDDPNNFNASERDVFGDMALKITRKLDGVPIGEYPVYDSPGMQKSLEYFKSSYGNPPIYIYENGQTTPSHAPLNDTSRVKYLAAYIGSVLDALRNGSDTRGYFQWSFLDLYELFDGYNTSYGLYFVDRNDPDLKRYPKLSAHWYSNFFKVGNISSHGFTEAEKKIYTLQKKASHISDN